MWTRRICGRRGRRAPGSPKITVRAFHAEELPFPSESFDLVLLFEAIYYLPDVRRFFKETQRVLRPGGTLLIVTVNPEWDGFNPSPLCTRYWSAAELLAALEEAGFAARVQGAFPETARLDRTGHRSGPARGGGAAAGPAHDAGKGAAETHFLWTAPRRFHRWRAASTLPPALDELDVAGSRRHRVLYATPAKRPMTPAHGSIHSVLRLSAPVPLRRTGADGDLPRRGSDGARSFCKRTWRGSSGTWRPTWE